MDDLHRLYTCVGASTIAATLTHPIDVLKVRIQNRKMGEYKRISDVLFKANGYGACILRNSTFIGSKMFVYESIKDKYELKTFRSKLIAGSVSGAIGSLIGTPFDKILVEMQTNQKDKMLDVIKNNYTNGGVTEFWNAGRYTMMRTVAITMCQLSVYDEAKEYFTRRNYSDNTSFLAGSLCASISSSIVSNPLDICKTRQMANVEPNTIYNILHVEGIRSLWKGTNVTMMRQIPLHGIRFYTLEVLNKYYKKQKPN